MAQFASNLKKKKKPNRKEATHNGNKARLLIENYFVKLSSQVSYRDSQTNPYIFVCFPSH